MSFHGGLQVFQPVHPSPVLPHPGVTMPPHYVAPPPHQPSMHTSPLPSTMEGMGSTIGIPPPTAGLGTLLPPTAGLGTLLPPTAVLGTLPLSNTLLSSNVGLGHLGHFAP